LEGRGWDGREKALRLPRFWSHRMGGEGRGKWGWGRIVGQLGGEGREGGPFSLLGKRSY